MSTPDTIASLAVRTCLVPLDPPVSTAIGAVTVAPLVLIDLTTRAGVTGSTYLFTYSPVALKPVADLVRGMAPLVEGRPLAPSTLSDELQRRFRLLGAEGLVLMAIAGIDMAAWDATAKAVGLPLARLLGGAIRPLPAYASLRAMAPDVVAREAGANLALGFRAFKFKVGWPDVAEDVAAIRAVRAVVGDGATLMVDFNQSLSVPEAKRRVAAFADLGLGWVEEPVIMSDVAGQAEIRRVASMPIQGGENWWGPADAARSIGAGATDLVMPDAMKIGGVTGWMRAAALADAAGLPMSSHIFPEVSAHLMCVTPTAHLLEHLDLAGPILATPTRIVDGAAVFDDAPGSGIAWDEAAVARFAV